MGGGNTLAATKLETKMNRQTQQLGAVITGKNTSDGAGVKLKRIVNQQHKNAFKRKPLCNKNQQHPR